MLGNDFVPRIAPNQARCSECRKVISKGDE